MNTLTLLGIDGLGIGVQFYIKIFELCCKEFNRFKEIKLFTAAENPTNTINDLNIEFIKIPKLSYADFNVFCLLDVAKHVNTTHALFVQTDGFVNEGKLWNEDYFNYDFVGQPWLHDSGEIVHPWVTDKNESVGEGGFCLRSKKLMDIIAAIDPTIIKTLVYNYKINEDILICKHFRDALKAAGCKFIDPASGKKFCAGINNNDVSKLSGSFGFHANEYVIPVLEKYKQKYGIDYTKDVIKYKK